MMEQPRVAAVITTWFPYSHADVIVTKFLRGFPTDDQGLVAPRAKLVSAWLDQRDPRDLAMGYFFRYGVDYCESIRAALAQRRELRVDGVLLIGEHGDYPEDELGRQLYPRRALFEQICGVFAECGTVCPVFCDKGLGATWDDALWMVERARQLGVPFLAGSSLPLAWRRPWLEVEPGSAVDGAVTVAFGHIERYGLHAVELLQAFVERRRGGETGVAAVEYLEGEAVWAALDDGRIDRELFDAAIAGVEELPAAPMREQCARPMAMLFEYRDGLRAASVMLNGWLGDFAFAGRVNGRVAACEAYLQRDFPHGHFNYLSLNIEEMFVTGRPPWPIERTLLTTGMTDAIMRSKQAGGRLETPWLSVEYRCDEPPPWRTEHPRPCGANVAAWPPAG